MERCLGIISYSKTEKSFGLLCNNRPPFMLPFGGRYRIVDFALSNMVNHNIRTVAVYTGEKVRSIMDHLGNGKPWELNRRINGLFIFPPQSDDDRNRVGDVYQYHKTEDFFLRSKEDYVYIVNSNIIGKINLTEVFDYFRRTDSDITLIYKDTSCNKGVHLGTYNLVLDSNGDFKNIGINLGTKNQFNMFLDTGFVKKKIFLDIIRRAMEYGEDIDFRQALLRYKEDYRISTYPFQGHIENIRDIKSYYNSNMNLLDRRIFQEMFFQGGPIYTKSKDEPPALYSNEAKAEHSLIGNGCIIKGNIENSILFRGVKIGRNTTIKNSIIMQKSEIMGDALLVDTILDKYVTIEEGVNLVGSKTLPYIVEKNAIEKREWF